MQESEQHIADVLGAPSITGGTTQTLQPEPLADQGLLGQQKSALAKRLWPSLAILVTFAGTVLLGFSFLATGSELSVIDGTTWFAPRHEYVKVVGLCVKDAALTFEPTAGYSYWRGCPAIETAKPIAAVTRESRLFFLGGWILVVAGTLWQVWLTWRFQPPL